MKAERRSAVTMKASPPTPKLISTTINDIVHNEVQIANQEALVEFDAKATKVDIQAEIKSEDQARERSSGKSGLSHVFPHLESKSVEKSSL